MSEDQALEFNVVANDIDLDSDSLRAIAVYNPPGNSGVATLDFSGDITYSAIGSFDYLSPSQSSTESFTYIVSDGHAGSDEGFVDVTITGANDVPVARPDQITLVKIRLEHSVLCIMMKILIRRFSPHCRRQRTAR